MTDKFKIQFDPLPELKPGWENRITLKGESMNEKWPKTEAPPMSIRATGISFNWHAFKSAFNLFCQIQTLSAGSIPMLRWLKLRLRQLKRRWIW